MSFWPDPKDLLHSEDRTSSFFLLLPLLLSSFCLPTNQFKYFLKIQSNVLAWLLFGVTILSILFVACQSCMFAVCRLIHLWRCLGNVSATSYNKHSATHQHSPISCYSTNLAPLTFTSCFALSVSLIYHLYSDFSPTALFFFSRIISHL